MQFLINPRSFHRFHSPSAWLWANGSEPGWRGASLALNYAANLTVTDRPAFAQRPTR